jgi:hypothetical protein
MKTALVFFLLAFSTAAQEKTVPPWLSACGPSDVKFDVNKFQTKSPAEPQPSKALVYVVEDTGHSEKECLLGCITVRVGLDGAWVGANQGTTQFSFSVEPGEHHLCANWQSKLGRLSAIHSLANFTAEPGKVYYFRTRVWAGDKVPFLDLDPVNSDQGRYLVATSSLALSHAKK